MKKKILTFIFLITVFSNYSNILKAEIIEGFCLVKRIDLEKAKLSPDDYFRFEGKEIIFAISFDENLLADISKNEEVSVITGMYGGTKEFEKTANGVKYKNEIELNADKEDEFVKYNYNNTIRIVDGKITNLYAKVDQSGFSFNSWNFKIDCRDHAYTEAEKQQAKKESFLLDKTKGMPEWFPDLVEKVIKEGDSGKLSTGSGKTKLSNKGVLPLNYTLFLEEDREDYMIFFRYPDGSSKGTIIYYSKSNYAQWFKSIYGSGSNLVKTFIAPMEFNFDGAMKDYLLPEYKLNDFIYKFLIRKDYYILEFESKIGLERINSYYNSKKSFSIASTDDEVWQASTYKELNNIDDYKLLANTNPKTICGILSEPLILNVLNKELGTANISEKLKNNGIDNKSVGCK